MYFFFTSILDIQENCTIIIIILLIINKIGASTTPPRKLRQLHTLYRK